MCQGIAPVCGSPRSRRCGRHASCRPRSPIDGSRVLPRLVSTPSPRQTGSVRPWFLSLLFAACSTPRESCPDASCFDASVDSGLDGASPGDASFDAFSRDAPLTPLDAPTSTDARVGAPCDLNRECASDQTCLCDVACTCQVGPRGTGGLGEPCSDGTACVTALCVEGPVEAAFHCTVECRSDADCADPLPRCIPVFAFAQICARAPPP